MIKQNNFIIQKHWIPLNESLTKIAIFQDDITFVNHASTFFKKGKPTVIFLVESSEQVVECLRYVSNLNIRLHTHIPLSIKSGGHGMSNHSTNDGGIIIDLSKLNRVKIINKELGLVTIEPGALWGDVAQCLSKENLILSSGDYGDTGVGGLATSGGIGFLIRKQGLTIDRIIRVKIVTPVGEEVIADKVQNKELFWAIQGGGSQVGVVTQFTFQAEKKQVANNQLKTPIYFQNINQQTEDLRTFVNEWKVNIESINSNMSSFLKLSNSNEDKTMVQIDLTNIWDGCPNKLSREFFSHGLTMAKTTNHCEKAMSYSQLVKSDHQPLSGDKPFYVRNILVKDLTENFLNTLRTILDNHNILSVEIRSIGGKMNDLDKNYNAWRFRDAKFFVALWSDTNNIEDVDSLFNLIQSYSEGVYIGYSSKVSDSENNLAWPGSTGKKLRQIVNKVNPNHLITQTRYI
ncbi:UNVERIFIED_ORG: hypothetical protein ABIC58_001111 [Leuconostoc holzapfelii]